MKEYKGQFEVEINNAAKEHGVNPYIIAGMIEVESNFQPESKSPLGSLGLMRLMPGTCRELGIDNPLDPQQNINGGTKWLSDRLKEFNGNMEFALAAYNCGAGNVKKYKGIPPFVETKNYVQKVLNNSINLALNS